MNLSKTPLTSLAMILATSVALAGCFGPFKKKSGGGGGGGGGEEEPAEESGGGKSTNSGGGGDDGADPSPPSPPPPPGAKDGFGCLQGVLTNGFTGDRMEVDGSKLFVLIRGTKLQANKVDGLTGEYFICEIPVEETYPVFAYYDGYMPFESEAKIISTRAKRVEGGGQAVVEEVKIPDPILRMNMRLFPLNTTGRDLRVRALHNGSPVKDAIVDIEPQSAGASGTFGFEGTFANSEGTRILPLRATTGDDGYATFEGSKLSLGAAYKIWVHAPAASDLSAGAHADIVLGVSGALESDLNTYDMNVILDEGNKSLAAISCSTQFQNYNGAGSIKIAFNRAVTVLDPNHMDTGAVALGGANYVGKNSDPLELVEVISPENNVSEQVAHSVSNNILTLTPKFKGNDTIKPLDNSDPDDANTLNGKNKNASVTWTFSKVFLKVTGDNDANRVALSSLIGASPLLTCPNTVRFFPEFDAP